MRELSIVGAQRAPIGATPIDRDGKPVHYSVLRHLKETVFPRSIERPIVDSFVSGPDGVPTRNIPADHPSGRLWPRLDEAQKAKAWMEYERSRAYTPDTLPEIGADGLTLSKLLAVTPSVTTFESSLDAGPPRIKAPHTSGAVLATSIVCKSDFASGFFRGAGGEAPGVSRFSMGTSDGRGRTQPGFALKAFGRGPNPSGNGLFYVSPDPVTDPDTFYTAGGTEPMVNLIGTPKSALLRAIPENAFELVAHPGHRHLDQLTGYDATGKTYQGEVPAASLRPSDILSMARIERNPTEASRPYEELRLRRFREIDAPIGIADLSLNEVALHDEGRRARLGEPVTLRVPDAEGNMREIQAVPVERVGDRMYCDLRVNDEDRWAIRGHLDPRLELQRRIRPGDTLYSIDLSWSSGASIRGAAEVRADSEMVVGFAGDRELAFQHLHLDSERQLTRLRKGLWGLTAGRCAALDEAEPPRCPFH